jgi:hypothetical protein
MRTPTLSPPSAEGSGPATTVAVLLLIPMPRAVRGRLRLRHPGAAETSDAVFERLAAPLVAAGLVCFALGVITSLPVYFGGLGLGFLSGVPFVIERRRARRRLAALPPMPSPLLPAAGPDVSTSVLDALREGRAADALAALPPLTAGDPAPLLWARALAAAGAGDEHTARACAVRCLQLDPRLRHVLSDAGLALCRRGRFTPGLRLLERATEAEGAADPRARRALVEGRRLAGRLHDAVAALEDHDRRGLPRRPSQSA